MRTLPEGATESLSKCVLCALVVAGLCSWVLFPFASLADATTSRRGPSITSPSRLPWGRLTGGKLYSIVLPGNGVSRDAPLVDWDYGFWEYSVYYREARLLMPLEESPWLQGASFVGILPGRQFLFHIDSQTFIDTNDGSKRLYLVSFSPLRVRTASLEAYSFDLFGLFPALKKFQDVFILESPYAFKVLNYEELLNERDSDSAIRYPELGIEDDMSLADVLPLNTGEARPNLFLLVDSRFGFRVIDGSGRLLHQAGYVLPGELLRQAYFSFSGDPWGLYRLLGAVYTHRERYSKVIYSSTNYIAITPDNLVAFYDRDLQMVFVCSPFADLFMYQREPLKNVANRGTDWVDKDVVGAGIVEYSQFMILYEDGSYFSVDFSDVSDKVRCGEIDPLAGLKELLSQQRGKSE